MRKTKLMKKTNQFGFTLIELLVVISIIGLLSTMAVVSLNSARQKSRDAKRISDVKQLSSLIELENANLSVATAIAVGAGSMAADGLTTTATGPGEVSAVNVARFTDPTATTAGTNACSSYANAAAAVAAGSCKYSFANAATTADYEICFMTEQTSPLGAAGVYSVQEGGVIASGCTF